MLRVALAEDHAPTRARLAQSLERSGRVRIVALAADGAALIDRLAALAPDELPHVVVTDVEMPRLDGIATTARVRERWPAIDVLVFTVFEDDERLFSAIAAGAAGYLLKDHSAADVLAALDEVAEGGAPVSPTLARRLLDHVRQNAPRVRPAGPSTFSLTEREIDVLRGVVDGLTNAEIAERLFVSPTTVKTHVRHIYEKLHVSSRAEVTRRALRDGLVG